MSASVLYGAEAWRTTATAMNTLFIISNQELWQLTRPQPVEEEILQGCWRWIGHTISKLAKSTTRYAFFWNPQGKRKRGKPKNTWRNDLEADRKMTGLSWGQQEKLPQTKMAGDLG